jgi:thioredoxin-like negative regulator of GroEL
MNLGRFREAIAELERVLPSLKDRSAVPAWLAFSYVSVGDIAKAEAVLTSAHGADAAKRELQDLRAAGAR